jgi:hypothetical protein
MIDPVKDGLCFAEVIVLVAIAWIQIKVFISNRARQTRYSHVSGLNEAGWLV